MDTIEAALKTIVIKSPAARAEALKALRAAAAGSPAAQQRYNTVAETALADPEADFSQAERELILSAIDLSYDDSRNYTLRVRLTQDERRELLERASAQGMTLSQYVRNKIFD